MLLRRHHVATGTVSSGGSRRRGLRGRRVVALFYLSRPTLYRVPFTGAPLAQGDLSLRRIDVLLVVIGVPTRWSSTRALSAVFVASMTFRVALSSTDACISPAWSASSDRWPSSRCSPSTRQGELGAVGGQPARACSWASSSSSWGWCSQGRGSRPRGPGSWPAARAGPPPSSPGAGCSTPGAPIQFVTGLRSSPHGERAGDGNRTRMTSLEGWSSTIELHPRGAKSRTP